MFNKLRTITKMYMKYKTNTKINKAHGKKKNSQVKNINILQGLQKIWSDDNWNSMLS